ncbi:MAG: hypothetical protein WC707_04555 [Candidatus Babeliaceae bacterium]
MKKLLIGLALAVGVQVCHGYTVNLRNATDYPVDFYVHSSLAGCCYGCGIDDKSKCKVSVAPQESRSFNFKKDRGVVCAGACIKCVSARIHTGKKDIEATFDLQDIGTIKFMKSQNAPYATSGTVFLMATGKAKAAGAIILAEMLANVGVAAGEAIAYQCTDMEITLHQQGKDFGFSYKKK